MPGTGVRWNDQMEAARELQLSHQPAMQQLHRRPPLVFVLRDDVG